MEDVEKQETLLEPQPSQRLRSRELKHITTDSDYGDRADTECGDDDSLPPKDSHATGHDIGRTVSRRETVLSRILTRPAVGEFIHPLTDVKTTVDSLVDFEGPDDPYRPVNWPMRKKLTATALYALTTMAVTWASATYSAGQRKIAEEFNIGMQTATLGTTLFLFGFGTGPLLWAPLSEVYGRKIAVLPPMFIVACFSFGTATAKDVQTIMITRFFSAFFSAAPVTNTGGVLADLFPPSERGIAIAAYAMAVVIGPVIG